MTAHASSLKQQQIILKHKDPGCLTIAIKMGETVVERALLDLGASVNLLPYSVYEELSFGELKPTDISFCLADRTVGILRELWNMLL